MDETLRVKIIADTTTAQSSLKQLNKESNNLGSNTNVANAAIDKLDKALNSLGFRSIKLKAISDGFKEIRASGNGLQNQLKKISGSFDKLREFKLHGKAFDGLGDRLRMSTVYMSQLEKKAPEAAKKINSVFDATKKAWLATKDSDVVLNISGLSNVKKAIEDLTTSRNKAIKNTLNEEDFQGLKDNLLKASIAGAKGARKEYVEALRGIENILGSSLEKNTLEFQLDKLYTKGKLTIQGLGNLAKSTISKIGSLLSKLGKGLLIGGALGAITGAIALVKNAFDVSQLGDDIDKTSQKVGMSTNAFQKWAYVLERCGISTSQLQTSMRALTRNSMGNNASYFKQLGIDPSGLSQQQLFNKTVTALQNISDSTERARMAYKLFGQSSAELAPLLAISSAEVQRLSYQYDLLGATMSGKVVRASADMQDAITDLKAAWQGLKNTLAQAIIPIITKIIIRLTVFVAKINMILQALFGVELEYNDVVESTQTVTKNTNDTVTAVKKLKTLIAGFDELNIFPSQDNGASVGSFLDDLADYGSDIAPTIGNILPPEAIAELENFRDNILPGIVEKINEWKETWEKLKEAYNEGDLGGIFKILGEHFDSPFLTGLGDAIDWVLDKVHALEEWLGGAKLLGWEMPSSLQEFLGFTEDWHIDWEHPLGLDIDFDNSPMGKFDKWIKDLLDKADKAVVDTWGKVKNWFNQSVAPKFTLAYWQEKFKPIKEGWDKGGLPGAVKAVWDSIVGWFNQNVSPKFTLNYWKTRFESIRTGLANTPIVQKAKEIWGSVKSWWDTNVAAKFNASPWKQKFDSIIQGLKNTPIVGKVKETWNSIKEWWGKNISPKFTIAYWKEKFNIIPNGLGYASILTKMREKWAEVKSWWDKNVSSKFTWTYWRDKFNSIKSGLANVSLVQAAKNMINGLINTLESGLNSIIDRLNGSGILSALRSVGVNVWLNRVYIPRLAKGGIIDSPTVAMMGEYPGAKQNPEIVTPENKLTQIFENSNEDIVNVLVQGFRQIVTAIENNQTEVKLDGKSLLKSVSNANNEYRLQTGKGLI